MSVQLIIQTQARAQSGVDKRFGAAAVARDFETKEMLSFDPVVGEASRRDSFALNALIHYLRLMPEGVSEVVIDCEFPVKGLTQWIKRWESNGWTTTSGDPVKMKKQWIVAQQELQRVGASIRHGVEPGLDLNRVVMSALDGIGDPVSLDRVDYSEYMDGSQSAAVIPRPSESAPTRLPGQGIF